MTILGGVLAAMRTARQMTQRQLGDHAGMSALTISRTERDVSVPHKSDLVRLIGSLASVMPLTPHELEALVSHGLERFVLSTYATMAPAAVEGSRRACEAMLSELLNGMDPQPVAQLLLALLAMKNARPMARAIHPPPAPAPAAKPPIMPTSPTPTTPMRVSVYEGTADQPETIMLAHVPLSDVASSLSASLDVPADRIAAALRAAVRAS